MASLEIADSLLKDTKVSRALNGHLVPRGRSQDLAYLRLSNVYSCVVLDSDGKEVIAIAALIRYSASQAYCTLGEVDVETRRKLLRLDKSCVFTLGEAQNHKSAQVSKEREGVRNPDKEPLFMIHHRHKSRPALEQILETVMENALGVLNLELRKNVTIDLMTEDKGDWRDHLGFCVSDNREFLEVRLGQGSRLAHLLPDSPDFSVEKCQDLAAIIQFDRQVSQLERSEYLFFLAGLPGTDVFLVRGEGGDVAGFSICFDGTILCLYADSETASRVLLRHSLTQADGRPVTMTLVADNWIHQVCEEHPEMVVERRVVSRFHTTSPPRQIDWDCVFVLNAGMHII